VKKVNQFKTFIIVAVIIAILGTIAITMRMDTTNAVVRTLNDGISSVQRVVVELAHTVRNFGQSTFDLFETYEENQRLRREMYNVELVNIELALLREENELLREMLDIDVTLSDFERIRATTVGRDINAWHDFLTVDQGRSHGVELGMAVLSLEGYLIGRITEVSYRFSRFHLMKPHNTDIRTQVKILGTSGSIGTLHGYDADTGELIVRQVPHDIEIEIGAQVMTTGLGGVFPRGLLAGHVTRYERSTDGLTQNVFLENNVAYDDLRFVFIIKRAMAAVEMDELISDDDAVENADSAAEYKNSLSKI